MLEELKYFKKILLLASNYKLWMFLAVLIGFFTVGSGIGLMMTSAYLISKAAIQTPIFELQVAIVGVRFFGISRGVFRYAERYISHEITFKLLAKFRVWFFKTLVPLVPSKSIDFTNGDLLTRSIEDIENLEHIFIRVISPPLILIGVLILMFFLLNLFNVTYAIVFSIVFILSALGIPLFTYILGNTLGKKIVILKSKLKDFAIDGIGGMAELIIYNQEKKWNDEYNKIQFQLAKSEYKMNLIQSLHEGLTGLAMNLTVFIMLFYAIPNVTSGLLNGVYLAVISIGVMASFEIVFQLPNSFQFLSKSLESVKRLFEITETQSSELKEKHFFVNIPSDYKIKIKELSFEYSDTSNVLSNINFEIKKGEHVAIVGASGSGKSTLANLLLGFWEIKSGDIQLGNISYNNISPYQIRDYVSAATQKVDLFTGTIKDNLLVANSSANDNEIFACLDKVGLANFVNTLPNKLNTHIGELGQKLSGGESKRLAVARILLRNTPIMIFDEINSHVDNLTEGRILETIKNLPLDKTVIFITHRLVQMEMFDKIIVLANGKIVGMGDHFELLQNNNYYQKLIKSKNEQLII